MCVSPPCIPVALLPRQNNALRITLFIGSGKRNRPSGVNRLVLCQELGDGLNLHRLTALRRSRNSNGVERANYC
jgi:hypothetical protein